MTHAQFLVKMIELCQELAGMSSEYYEGIYGFLRCYLIDYAGSPDVFEGDDRHSISTIIGQLEKISSSNLYNLALLADDNVIEEMVEERFLDGKPPKEEPVTKAESAAKNTSEEPVIKTKERTFTYKGIPNCYLKTFSRTEVPYAFEEILGSRLENKDVVDIFYNTVTRHQKDERNTTNLVDSLYRRDGFVIYKNS